MLQHPGVNGQWLCLQFTYLTYICDSTGSPIQSVCQRDVDVATKPAVTGWILDRMSLKLVCDKCRNPNTILGYLLGSHAFTERIQSETQTVTFKIGSCGLSKWCSRSRPLADCSAHGHFKRCRDPLQVLEMLHFYILYKPRP